MEPKVVHIALLAFSHRFVGVFFIGFVCFGGERKRERASQFGLVTHWLRNKITRKKTAPFLLPFLLFPIYLHPLLHQLEQQRNQSLTQSPSCYASLIHFLWICRSNLIHTSIVQLCFVLDLCSLLFPVDQNLNFLPSQTVSQLPFFHFLFF